MLLKDGLFRVLNEVEDDITDYEEPMRELLERVSLRTPGEYGFVRVSQEASSRSIMDISNGSQAMSYAL